MLALVSSPDLLFWSGVISTAFLAVVAVSCCCDDVRQSRLVTEQIQRRMREER